MPRVVCAGRSSGPIVVAPAWASELVVGIAQSSTGTAGQSFANQPVIEKEYQYSNLETGDDSTVITAAIHTGTGPLQGTTRVAVYGGLATFTNLSDDKADPLRLVFSSGNLTPADSVETVVSPEAASQLVFEAQPSTTATAGQPFAVQPVIVEEDPYGNVVTSDDSTGVTAALTGGLLQGTTVATVTGGLATFDDLADDTAETIALDFSSGNLIAATSQEIAVSAAPASQLVIRMQPSASATAGQALGTQPVIEEEDAYGNLETADNSSVVTVSMTGVAEALLGTTNCRLTGGVATFAGLADDKAGRLTLKFACGRLAGATSGPVTIVPAAPAALVIIDQPPSTVTAGDGFGFGFVAEDRFGNVIPSFDGSVTVGMANDPAGGSLNGSLAASAVEGAASFAGLTLHKAADGYTLRASAARGSVTVTLANGAGGTLGGSATAPFVNGIATFAGLTLNGAGGYALQIIGNGLIAAVSSSFTVTPPRTIIGEQVLTSAKGKHRKLSGFALLFIAPLVASRAQDAANYTVTQTV